MNAAQIFVLLLACVGAPVALFFLAIARSAGKHRRIKQQDDDLFEEAMRERRIL